MIRTIKKLKSMCLYLSVSVIATSNIINYFYCYKYLDDVLLQWKVAMIAIATTLFLMAFYMWLNESLKNNRIKILITGWSALYLLFNLIGVVLGYNLHTKGFMAILFITISAGIGHICIRSWQKFS